MTIEWMDRFVKLMDVISDCPAGGIGITELSKQTLLSKGSLHRMLQNMCGYHLVVQSAETKKYMLGPKAMSWGSTFLQNRDPVGLLAQYCKQVGDETGLYAFICRYQANEVFCTHTHQPLSTGANFFVHVGQRMPLNAAAGAQIILAYQPDEVIDGMLEKEALHPYTPYTLTDPEQLRRKIEQARQTGEAYCKQELELGTSALSVPIFHCKNQALISMSLVGKQHYFDENKDQIGKALHQAADQASDHLSAMHALSSLF